MDFNVKRIIKVNAVKNIPSAVLLIFLAVVFVLLPSVVHEPFMDATQTGKILFFLLVLLVILPAAAIVFISVTSPCHFVFTRLDLIVSVWFVYLIADGIIRGTPWSLSLAEFAGLALFYVVLRLIPLKHFKWLFFAFITGGIIQAVYGKLQLWGYYPSRHNLFKLTGSFFNPGPYTKDGKKEMKVELTVIEEIKAEILKIIEKATLEKVNSLCRNFNLKFRCFTGKNINNRGAYRSVVLTPGFKLQKW
jgi:hypothetical protein